MPPSRHRSPDRAMRRSVRYALFLAQAFRQLFATELDDVARRRAVQPTFDCPCGDFIERTG
jgi:hypothetical protein